MAAGGREVVTLQFGSYSNYVGAHFWNAQEALFTYDHLAPVRCLDVRRNSVSDC